MARWLATVAHLVGRGRTPGRLYDLGAYPGLTEARRSDEWVIGDLYYLPKRQIFRALDRYEAGTGRSRRRFVRVHRPVKIARGRTVTAWLYLYRPSILRRPRIAHGDYDRYLQPSVHRSFTDIDLSAPVASATILRS